MPNIGVFPYVAATPVGQVRAITGDTDPIQIDPPLGLTGEYIFYSDAELEALLSVWGGNVKRTAAQALRSIAASKMFLMQGKWRTDDLTVDSTAMAEVLRKLANDLDAAADAEVANLDIFEVFYPEQGNLIPDGAIGVWGVPWRWARQEVR